MKLVILDMWKDGEIMKYIRGTEEVVIFSCKKKHADIARDMNISAVSAGFWDAEHGVDRGSDSLGVESKPEDTALIASLR